MHVLEHKQAILEGAYLVTGKAILTESQKGKPLVGKGFMELVGYMQTAVR